MTDKIGIQETKDCFAFVGKVLDELAVHKADDGKIDISEWIQTAVVSAPSAAKAIVGIEKVGDELKDLSTEELKEVAELAIETVQKLIILFFPGFKVTE